MTHWLRTILGILLIIMGIAGSLLPIIPGFVFFAAAVGVLGTDHVIIKWCKTQLERLEVFKDHPIVKWCRKQLQRVGIWNDKDFPPGGPPPAP